MFKDIGHSISKGKYIGMYEGTIEYYFGSLSNSLKERRKRLGLKNEDIYPEYEDSIISGESFTHRQRVSKIMNNKKSENYPNLLSRGEIEIFTKNLKYKNSKEMLWDHVDWDMMYDSIIQDFVNKTVSMNLYELFEKSLMDYVPFSIVYQEWNQDEYAKEWHTESQLKELRKEAAKWYYAKNRELNVSKLEEMFKKYFLNNGLSKFPKNFSHFIDNYFKEISTETKINNTSLGQQTAVYKMNYLKAREKLNENIEYVYFDKKNDEAKLLEKYIKTNLYNMDELKEYQKKFDKLMIAM